MHHSLVTVPAATAVGMLYARAAAYYVRPGLWRLLALSPVLALLLVLPLAIPLYSARGTAAFFLVWLGEFKLLLLASGRGPLDAGLRPLPFVFTGALPVKLLHHKRPADHGADAAVKTTKTAAAAALPFLSSSIKLAVMVALAYVFRRKDQMHPYVTSTLYAVFIYCNLDFVLPCVAAVGRAVLGMELEPQFDRPYLSASLGEFWGRRWNLMVSAVLRPSVYAPVRARLGAAAAVLTTFLASGLMHEVVVYYVTFRPPTGEVTAFFALHGASLCAEKWWCARTRRFGGRAPPRAVAAPLVLAYVAATAFWLFFPALFGGGMDDRFIAEMNALLSAVVDSGGRLLRWARS